jgi:hypothetical protein
MPYAYDLILLQFSADFVPLCLRCLSFVFAVFFAFFGFEENFFLVVLEVNSMIRETMLKNNITN